MLNVPRGYIKSTQKIAYLRKKVRGRWFDSRRRRSDRLAEIGIKKPQEFQPFYCALSDELACFILYSSDLFFYFTHRTERLPEVKKIKNDASQKKNRRKFINTYIPIWKEKSPRQKEIYVSLKEMMSLRKPLFLGCASSFSVTIRKGGIGYTVP